MIPTVSIRSSEITTVVYDSKVTAMNYPGGDVYRYARHKTAAVSRAAKMFAPKRTGRLAGGIRIDMRPTPSRVVGRVRSTAYYSVFVHEGTRTPILPKKGKYLSIPQSRYSTSRRKLRPFVRGQAPNPFLAKALAVGMRQSYPSPIGPANPFV